MWRAPLHTLRRARYTSRARLVEEDTDTAFLDSSNLPNFNRAQLEGRMVRSLTFKEVWVIGVVFTCAVGAALVQGYRLQVQQHDTFAARAEANRFERKPLFAKRGTIEDRLGEPLAWNEENIREDGTEEDFPKRVYVDDRAVSHIIGYVQPPRRDKKGNWWRTTYETHGGIEGRYDDILAGTNGNAVYEVDAQGSVVSFFAVEPPEDGARLQLTLDKVLTDKLYTAIADGAKAGFIGGAGVIMDADTGAVVAMTSYPSFDLEAFTTQAHTTTQKTDPRIAAYLTDKHYPLLDRTYQGTYIPGSIVKPFVALAALEEGVIDPATGIVSTGKLVVPNPYNPDKPSVFKDWKAHGWVDMREAIAVSSDVYFYEVGGGFGTQRGLGIDRLHKWMTSFGFGTPTGFILDGEVRGNVPSPEWKTRAFAEDNEWNIGNTYHSSIGQYGWLTTPLQATRALSALVNGGLLFTPHLVDPLEPETPERIEFKPSSAAVVLEGMRRATDHGTARAISIPGFPIGGKTGTAEVGAHKEHMNSWVMGFWPLKKPKFVFAVVLEKAPAGTLRGAAPAMRPFFESLLKERSPYVRGEYPQPKPKEETKKDEVGTEASAELGELPPEEFIPEPEVPAFVPDATQGQ